MDGWMRKNVEGNSLAVCKVIPDFSQRYGRKLHKLSTGFQTQEQNPLRRESLEREGKAIMARSKVSSEKIRNASG
jgi:hypothetical protein